MLTNTTEMSMDSVGSSEQGTESKTRQALWPFCKVDITGRQKRACGALGLWWVQPCASWLVNLTSTRVILEEGTSDENYLHQIGLQASLWGIFFINDWSGRANLSVGGVTTGHVVSG